MSIPRTVRGIKEVWHLKWGCQLAWLFLWLTGCAAPLKVPEGEIRLRVALSASGREVKEIPLERYLLGVLEKEVPADWPIEALKAQAVASRTYALYRKEHPRSESYDVASDTSDQVFQLKRHYPEPYLEAVRETSGQSLHYEGKIFSAFFHSCCGGITERADQVWPEAFEAPLLQYLTDPYCEACPRYHWEFSLTQSELVEILNQNNFPVGDDGHLEIEKRDPSGRVSRLLLISSEGVQTISGAEFRRIVGNLKIRSTLFDLATDGETITFLGKGAGHGVGLCQWGAKGMAEQGRSYEEILKFYYPGAELVGAAETQPAETLPAETVPVDTE